MKLGMTSKLDLEPLLSRANHGAVHLFLVPLSHSPPLLPFPTTIHPLLLTKDAKQPSDVWQTRGYIQYISRGRILTPPLHYSPRCF